ncbi:hypothetical protein FHX37_2564 [Haloactinospora alba]|uniref:Uncharacterized protein n=1 Tax=Haloactinospora alba TaxID=405555 RepID=A0A543NL73_9ACTN|nr:hypothetical protein [Haloactinospora alba]TQN32588.1 hypothetical protein FHX37_2564 [Haloactinospora alba]
MPEMKARIEFEDDVTEKEADEHTRFLLRQLEQLNIERVELAETEGPSGTRGDAATLLGAVTLAGFAVARVLPHIVAVVQTWLETSAQKSVTLEVNGRKLQMTGRTTENEVKRYIAVLEEDASSSENVSEDGQR